MNKLHDKRALRALLMVATLAMAAQTGCVADPLPDHGGPLPDKDTSGGGGTDKDTTIPDVKCKTKDECEKELGDVGQCNYATCGADGKCKVEPKGNGTPCDADGSKCTVDDVCDGSGLCKAGKAKDCEDNNPCTTDSCETTSGDCENKPAKDGSKCDDGDECTENETCGAGKCQGGDVTCKCKPGDVSKCWQELGISQNDKCAGVPICKKNDKGGAAYVCEINEGSVITCPDGKDTACKKNTCQPDTGKCEFEVVNEGGKCDDGIKCTENDICKKGECVVASPNSDACFCKPGDIKKCWNKLNLFESDKLCDGEPFCSVLYDPKTKQTDYKCELNKGSVITCPNTKDTACKKNLCDVKDGKCKFENQNEGQVKCSDGNPCTANDTCENGECVGKVQTCSCKSDADCAGKEDGNLCNGTLFCDGKSGQCVLNPATVVSCASVDDSDCLVNFCYPATGKCKLTPRENIKVVKELKQEADPNNPGQITIKVLSEKATAFPTKVVDVFCNDGNPCTANDECTNGKCQPDQQICLCQSDADCKDKENGNLCDGTLYCEKATGKCKVNPVTVVSCPDAGENQCAQAACDKKTGKCTVEPLPDNKSCDDDNFCTASDSCQKGKCVPGTLICKCQSDAECAKDEDGDLCNGTLYCDKTTGKCKVNPATVVTCGKGLDTECLQNQCVKKTGKCQMQPANNFKACDAGTPCAASPVCEDGKCSWSANLCNCTVDTDCAYITAGNKCLGTAYCDKQAGGGTCVLDKKTAPVCVDDGQNPCAENQCDPSTGKCALVNKSSFTPCDDGNPCTASDTCNGGKCESGTDVCQCTVDKDCDPFDDGNLCNGALFCDKGVCKPNPGSVPAPCAKPGASDCIIQQCNPKTGKCEPQTNLAKCNDGNPCTLDSCNSSTQKCEHKAVGAGTGCVDSVTGSGVCIDDSKKLSICQPPPKPGLLFVPGGTVAVGCNGKNYSGGCADSTESPIHEVNVGGFWMMRFEVTVKQYTDCVTNAGCSAADTAPNCTYGQTGKDNHPINCVTWAQANDFCSKMYQGRLPREAEWAKAARGGCEFYNDKACKDEAQQYVWGNSPAPNCNRVIHDDATKGAGCGEGSTVPVGSLLEGDKSLYGINDLAGNVSEWVSDFYSGTFYSDAAATKDNPTGPTSGSTRVVRGASWLSKGADVRTAKRLNKAESTKDATIGFRCVVPL